MSILAQDTFQRPDQPGWGTASDGHVWTTSGASGSRFIAGNKGVISNASGDVHQQIAVTGTDMEITCRIMRNHADDVCGLETRFDASNGTTCYKLLFYGGDLHINKSVTGNFTNHANYGGFTMVVGTGYWFKLRCLGNIITGKTWADTDSEPDFWMLSIANSDIASGGAAVLASTNTGPGVQFDQFSTKNLATQPLPESVIGIAYLYSRLMSSTPFLATIPGGVHRGAAPNGTAAPFIVIDHPTGRAVTTNKGVRLLTSSTYLVKVVGLAKDTQTLAEVAAVADGLVTTRDVVTINGGYIHCCYQDEPLLYDETPAAGLKYTHIGGLYFTQIEQARN